MIHPALVSAAIWLAANTGDDGGGESKKSGPIGLVVIIVLCVVCYFLFKSLSKHLRRVREGSFEQAREQAREQAASGPSGPSAAGLAGRLDEPASAPERPAAPPP
jgi:hypothetical protein